MDLATTILASSIMAHNTAPSIIWLIYKWKLSSNINLPFHSQANFQIEMSSQILKGNFKTGCEIVYQIKQAIQTSLILHQPLQERREKSLNRYIFKSSNLQSILISSPLISTSSLPLHHSNSSLTRLVFTFLPNLEKATNVFNFSIIYQPRHIYQVITILNSITLKYT